MRHLAALLLPQLALGRMYDVVLPHLTPPAVGLPEKQRTLLAQRTLARSQSPDELDEEYGSADEGEALASEGGGDGAPSGGGGGGGGEDVRLNVKLW